MKSDCFEHVVTLELESKFGMDVEIFMWYCGCQKGVVVGCSLVWLHNYYPIFHAL